MNCIQNNMTFGQKVVAILSSIRFWQLVVIGVIQALVQTGWLSGDAAVTLAQVVQLILGGSVAIGTIDSAAVKLGTAVGAKK